MAKFTISKFFSLVAFLLMMTVLFFWMVGQVTDLGLLFGFRTSHTVANDVASLITSIGGVPGEVSTKYNIERGNTQQVFSYEIDIADRIVCVTSQLGNDVSRATSDCTSHPYDLDERMVCSTVDGNLELEITKEIREEGVSIKIENIGEGECMVIA